MKKVLPLFSYVFHPLFIPLFACLFYFFDNQNYFNYTNFEIYLILFQVVIITICIPISFYYLLRSLGKIDSVMVSNLSQRKLPLIMQIILLIVLIKKGTTLDRIPELYFYFLAGLISTALTLVFLFFKCKISLHLIGMSSLLFFVIGMSIHCQINFIYIIIFLVLMVGFVASSRLEMKAHSNTELLLGFLVGMIPQLILWVFWL